MSSGVMVKKGMGDLWLSFLLSHFQYGQFWCRVREGMLEAYCWLLQQVPVGGWAAFPQFPLTGLKSLLGWHIPKPCGLNLGTEALEGARILPFWSAFLAIFLPLGILSLALTWGTCTMAGRHTVGEGSLSQASSTIVGAGATRSVLVCLSSPTASLSGAIWGTMEGCCPVLLWSGQPSTWLSDSPTP